MLLVISIQVAKNNKTGSTNFRPDLSNKIIILWLANLKVSVPNKLKFVLPVVHYLSYVIQCSGTK